MRKRELMGLFKFLESQGYETNSLSKFIFNLKNENEELKSQLKGTTHCYDESEHTQLKQKNEELKKELQKANDTLDTHDELIEKLKKELEEKNMIIKQCELLVSKVMDCYCERTDCSGRIKDSKQYDSLVQKVETQQQEFINYLEDEIHTIETTYSQINGNYGLMNEKLETLKEILQKYKEIIGEK